MKKIIIAVGALAGSTPYTSPVIDLGDSVNSKFLHALKEGVASAAEQLEIEQAIDEAFTSPANAADGTLNGYAQSAVNSTSAANMEAAGRVFARWARVKFTNGATPQTDLKITLTIE